MFDPFRDSDALDQEQAFDMLQELEKNTPDEIRRQRAHFRITIKARVTIAPGNASEMLKFRVQCVTGDLSNGGCRILSPTPLRVGDIYRLEFDRTALDVPMTFARCQRCLLIREDAFECGFSFFAPIALPENVDVRCAEVSD